MHTGIDPSKDQSYFLFATTKKQLDFVRFPLGSLTKMKQDLLLNVMTLMLLINQIAKIYVLFLKENNGDVVRKLRPGSIDAGNIIDINGNFLENIMV